MPDKKGSYKSGDITKLSIIILLLLVAFVIGLVVGAGEDIHDIWDDKEDSSMSKKDKDEKKKDEMDSQMMLEEKDMMEPEEEEIEIPDAPVETPELDTIVDDVQ